VLVIYHAQPGTSSAEKMALLASLASPTATVDARPPRPPKQDSRPAVGGWVYRGWTQETSVSKGRP
jgi:hypothetical protein